MKATTILIIEDDQNLAEMVASYLEKEGPFTALVCHDGVTGLEMAVQRRPDLIILDLRLPGIKGTEICRQLRKTSRTEATPIIMLSACTEEIDRVVSLEVGADDYVTKPFSLRELLLRIQAILRRVSTDSKERIVKIGSILINQDLYTTTANGKNVHLSRTEFRLLLTLAEHAGRVMSREEILETVWDDSHATIRAVDVHVTRLRAKLGDAGHQLRTVSGFGYTMDPVSD